MTWGLIRRDPAVRSLARWIPILMLNIFFFLGLYHHLVLRAGSPWPTGLAWILWSAAALYLGLAKVDGRCSDLDLTLPLSARRLWLAHVAALVLGGALILGLALVVAALASRFVNRLLSTPQSELDVVAVAMHLGAGLLLAIALLQGARPKLQRIPRDPGRVLWTVAVLVGVAGLVGWFQALPIYFALLPLAAAAAVAYRTYRALPEAFTVDGAVSATAPEADTGSSFTAKDWGRSRSALGVVLRTVLGDVKVWLNLVCVLLMGVLLGGGLSAWLLDIEELRYIYVPFVIYFLISFSNLVLRQLYVVDPLPLSRDKVLALFVLPQLALLVLGYGAGATLVQELRPDRVGFHYQEANHYVVIPLRHWEIVRSTDPETATTPWGETWKAGRRPLGSGSRWAIQSPVSTPPGSSRELVAWQLSRAVERVYGRRIAPEELSRRYLDVDPDGKVVPKAAGLTIADDYPDLVPRGSGPLCPLLLALVVPTWFLLLALVLRFCRAGVTKRVQLGVLWSILALLLVLVFAQLGASVADLIDPSALRGFLEIRILHLGESLVATVALWGMSVLLAAGSYLLVRAEFERIEVTAEVQPRYRL